MILSENSATFRDHALGRHGLGECQPLSISLLSRMILSEKSATFRDHALMADDPFGIREGEVAIDLPSQFDAGLYFIGRIRTPWTRREDCPKNPRESDAVCTIEVDERFAPGLADIETCSHLLG